MTREEEAIFYIKELQKTYASMDRKVAEAIDMVIEALKSERPMTKVLCGFRRCIYNQNGVCTKEVINLDGRVEDIFIGCPDSEWKGGADNDRP